MKLFFLVVLPPRSLAWSQAGSPRISQRIAHPGIIVGVLEPAKKFYGDILGFKEFWRGSKDGKVQNWTTLHIICLEVPETNKLKADPEGLLYQAAGDPYRQKSQAEDEFV